MKLNDRYFALNEIQKSLAMLIQCYSNLPAIAQHSPATNSDIYSLHMILKEIVDFVVEINNSLQEVETDFYDDEKLEKEDN